MNGWFKKNVGVVVQISVIFVILISTFITVRITVSQLETDMTVTKAKNIQQDECIYEINRTLGRIEGKLDSALGGE